MTAYYVSKQGSDSNAGTSAVTAFLTVNKASQTATSAGDCVFIGPGIFAEGDNVCTFADKVKIVGSGMDVTNITSTAVLGVKGCILSAAFIEDLTVTAAVVNVDGGAYVSQAPIGFAMHATTPQAVFPRCDYYRVKAVGDSDGFFFRSKSDTPTVSRVFLHDCVSQTKFDSYRSLSKAANNVTNNAWDFICYAVNCQFSVIGPQFFPSFTYRTVACGAGTFKMFGGSSSVVDNDAANVTTAAIYCDLTGSVEINDATLTSATSGANLAYDVYQSGSGTATVRKCSWNNTKTFGTVTEDGTGLGPTVKTIGSGGDYATLAAAFAGETATDWVVFKIKAGVQAAPSATGVETLPYAALTIMNNDGAKTLGTIVADNAGQAIITGLLSLSDSVGGAGPAFLEVKGIQFGSATTRGRLSFGAGGTAISNSSVAYALARDCFIRDSQAQSTGTFNVLSITPNQLTTCDVINCGFVSTASFTGGTKRGFLLNNSNGTGFLNCYHCSAWDDNCTVGIARAYSGTLLLDVRNCISVGSTNSKPSFANGTASGTLILFAASSGQRGSDSVWGTLDCTSGLTDADIFSRISTSISILKNNNTRAAASTTPVALDLLGTTRPQQTAIDVGAVQISRPRYPGLRSRGRSLQGHLRNRGRLG